MLDLTQKAEEYKKKLESLLTQKQEIERQIIILEEQFNQYKDKISQAFGTDNPQELKKIAEGYLEDIETLESQLQG
jgi:phage shock protein A